MIKDWTKKTLIIIIIVLIFAVCFDTVKILMTYYDTDRSANKMAENIAANYKDSLSKIELKNKAENLAHQNNVKFKMLEIQNNQLNITVFKIVKGTILTSRVKKLSSFNTIIAHGSAPIMEIKVGSTEK